MIYQPVNQSVNQAVKQSDDQNFVLTYHINVSGCQTEEQTHLGNIKIDHSMNHAISPLFNQSVNQIPVLIQNLVLSGSQKDQKNPPKLS